MSSISSITKAVSGLMSSQRGLQVTSHNISNANTKGYTRQQLLQSESSYLSIGNNGGYTMQVGLGVNCDEIRQIRDELADKRFRTDNSVLSYYQKLNATTTDIESMFDEPYGNTISDLLNTFWAQTQKLSTDPSGVETRLSFLSTSKVLASKLNSVSDSLMEYQMQLNSDLKASVNRANDIFKEIADYNLKIATAEAHGENANDYRDARNSLLDELSKHGHISYYEQADHQVSVMFEGHSVVEKQIVTSIKMQQAEPGSPFDIPVWTDTDTPVYDFDTKITAVNENDTGTIKAMLLARGNNIVGKETTWNDVALDDTLSCDSQGNAYIIPKIQMLLNDFTKHITQSVNECFNGTGIGTHLGKQGLPVFVAKQVPNHLQGIKDQIVKGDYTGITADQLNEYNDYLIGGNIEVNGALLESGGYNKLGTVAKPEDPAADAETKAEYAARIGDNSLIEKFLAECSTSETWYDKNPGAGLPSAPASAPYEKRSTIKDFFSELVTDIGSQGSLYASKANQKNISVINIENERSAIGSVSTDEEFSSMLKYQYAYNASSRMITVLDGMLDKIINQM